MTVLKKRYWFALHPDIASPIGGVKQAHRFAEVLVDCGREATIIQQSADFHPGWFTSQVATIALDDWRQRKDLSPEKDVVVLPETFIKVFDSYAPGLPKIIFNQNAAYSFGLGSKKADIAPAKVLELYRHPELLHVLCVSEHDQRLLRQGFSLAGAGISRLLNGIESDVFCPSGSKKLQIAYMPRKNGRDAAVVAAMLKAQSWFSDWQLVPIKNRSQSEVAEILQQSIAFMAFGHPEGFGLPLAEALACGCALIGYSGLGGRELFDLATEHDVGLEVAYGDWLGFIEAVAALDRSLRREKAAVLKALLKASKAVRIRYSTEAMRQSVLDSLSRWEDKLSVGFSFDTSLPLSAISP